MSKTSARPRPAAPRESRGGGRARNAAATRKAILKAAQQHFLDEGYDQAGVRAIAAGAGIDAALICRYFGSKQGLFSAVLAEASRDPMEVVAGDRGGFGERMAQAVLNPPPRPGGRADFIGLLARSSASPVASRLVLEHLEKRFIDPFAGWIGGKRRAEKARLMVAVLMGTAMFRKLQGSGPVDPPRLAALLQDIIDSP